MEEKERSQREGVCVRNWKVNGEKRKLLKNRVKRKAINRKVDERKKENGVIEGRERQIKIEAEREKKNTFLLLSQ